MDRAIGRSRPGAAQAARPSWWPAALAGVIAGLVAIGVSELVAGLVPGMPSLVTSMGDLVIALQPPGAKDVVVSLFGSNDKLALNVAVVVVALVVAALAGILAQRRFDLGAAVFVGFGVVAGIAGAREPLASPAAGALAAVIAVAAGLLALRALIDRVPGGRRSSPTRPATAATSGTMPDWDRRRFLIASAGTLGGAVVFGAVGRTLVDLRHPTGVVSTNRLPPALQPAPDPAQDQSYAIAGITPLVVPNDDFYRIDTALLVPQVDAETWSLSMTGMIDRPQSFRYDELLEMPLFEQYVTIACVSNQIGEHLVGNTVWTGVRLKELLAMAGVQAGATQIVGRSVDGFTVGFPTDWAMADGREPMVAVGMGREPLPAEHGFPARLIVPGLYGYVSATKWLSEIELTTREAVDGYWVPLGWAKDAPILTQSRIDTPAAGASFAAATIPVAGVAWAPDRGIDGVEVRFDDGAWQPAHISRPISKATWVQWRYDWAATSGGHTIEVRAIDGTGTVQTADVTPPAPDGARGHHRISVTVT